MSKKKKTSKQARNAKRRSRLQAELRFSGRQSGAGGGVSLKDWLKQQKKKAKKRNQSASLVSMCPIHGMYNADDLCNCYDEEGKMDGVAYEDLLVPDTDMQLLSPFDGSIGFCPIHGEATVNEDGIFQCGCFDEHGNKIKDADGAMIH
jgi:hypothetical protein